MIILTIIADQLYPPVDVLLLLGLSCCWFCVVPPCLFILIYLFYYRHPVWFSGSAHNEFTCDTTRSKLSMEFLWVVQVFSGPDKTLVSIPNFPHYLVGVSNTNGLRLMTQLLDSQGQLKGGECSWCTPPLFLQILPFFFLTLFI